MNQTFLQVAQKVCHHCDQCLFADIDYAQIFYFPFYVWLLEYEMAYSIFQ